MNKKYWKSKEWLELSEKLNLATKNYHQSKYNYNIASEEFDKLIVKKAKLEIELTNG